LTKPYMTKYHSTFNTYNRRLIDSIKAIIENQVNVAAFPKK
jgi:hypothetical protein